MSPGLRLQRKVSSAIPSDNHTADDTLAPLSHTLFCHPLLGEKKTQHVHTRLPPLPHHL